MYQNSADWQQAGGCNITAAVAVAGRAAAASGGGGGGAAAGSGASLVVVVVLLVVVVVVVAMVLGGSSSTRTHTASRLRVRALLFTVCHHLQTVVYLYMIEHRILSVAALGFRV
jgi:predicted metalloprotease